MPNNSNTHRGPGQPPKPEQPTKPRMKNTNKLKAIKLASGRYLIGSLVVVKHDMKGSTVHGHVPAIWCRADEHGGGLIGYTLKECVELANKPSAYAYQLARP